MNNDTKEVEHSIVGELLYSPEKISLVNGRLLPGDFIHPIYKKIFAAMIKIHEADEPIDNVTLEQRGIDPIKLSEIRSPQSENLNHWVKILLDKASIRRLAMISDKIRSDCAAGEKHSSEIISEALSDISKCENSNLEFKTETELLKEYMNEIEYRIENPKANRADGVACGYHELDKMLVYGGFPRGLITVIGAATSKGKSALSQAIKRGAAANGHKIVVVTLEDSAGANLRRDIASISHLQNKLIQSKQLRKEDWHKLFNAATTIGKWSDNICYIDDYPDNVREMYSAIESMNVKSKVDMVIVDYLQLVPSGQKFQKRQQHIDYVIETSTRFTRKNPTIALIIVTQMARHEGRPTLEKLYHSASIEQACHTAILIWDPEIDGWPRPKGGLSKGPLITLKGVDIAKNKDGPVGIIPMGWDGKSVRFYTPNPVDARDYLAALERANK